MKNRTHHCGWFFTAIWYLLFAAWSPSAETQEKVRLSYSSTDTINQVWTIAQDAGFYKKHGLDVDLVYIGSTTIGIAAIIAQDVQVVTPPAAASPTPQCAAPTR